MESRWCALTDNSSPLFVLSRELTILKQLVELRREPRRIDGLKDIADGLEHLRFDQIKYKQSGLLGQQIPYL